MPQSSTQKCILSENIANETRVQKDGCERWTSGVQLKLNVDQLNAQRAHWQHRHRSTQHNRILTCNPTFYDRLFSAFSILPPLLAIRINLFAYSLLLSPHPSSWRRLLPVCQVRQQAPLANCAARMLMKWLPEGERSGTTSTQFRRLEHKWRAHHHLSEGGKKI